MKEIFLLLGAFLVVAVNADGHVAFYPIEGRSRGGGSTCMIKSRSIEVDEDTTHGKQASINPGSIFIPNSMDDETSESGDDDYDDQSSDEEDDDSEYDDSGPAVAAYPPVPVQYGGGYGGGGFRPYAQFSNPETSVSVSSDMGFGPPQFYGGDKEQIKYKKKRGGGGKGKKKGGNINCIIITKGGHHRHHKHSSSGHRQKPTKLFGIFPIGGNRRSIARGLRALKN